MALNNTICTIVLNYNNYHDTIECLESLLNFTDEFNKILLVDNNSSDNSFLDIIEWIHDRKTKYFILDNDKQCNINEARVIAIKNKANLGYGAGNNVGINYSLKYIKPKFIFVLNNDTIIVKDTIYHLIKKMNDEPNLLICGLTIKYYNTNEIQYLGGAKFNSYFMISKAIKINDSNIQENIIEKELDYISGAALFFRSNFFNQFGFFDERYFLYFEEVDLQLRIGKDQIGYCKNSIILHKESATIGSKDKITNKTAFSDFHSFSSRIKFTKKLFPNRIILVYLLGIIYIIHRLANLKIKNAYYIFKSMFLIKLQ